MCDYRWLEEHSVSHLCAELSGKFLTQDGYFDADYVSYVSETKSGLRRVRARSGAERRVHFSSELAALESSSAPAMARHSL